MNTGKNVQQIVTAAVAAAGPSAPTFFQPGPTNGCLLVVKSSAALASFTLEGRVSPEAPFVTLMAADTGLVAGAGQKRAEVTCVMAEMRLNWTGNAGSVDAWLQG